MEDVPPEPQRDMEIIFVDNVRQVFAEALLPAMKAAKISHNGKPSVKRKSAAKSAKKSQAKNR
ncbi:MAG: hypothetical protein JMDDDDMK_00268 [Acidobacteria bacterium]|nr:hypothetical protein [Acidobacteriota bacterium]